MAKSYYDKNYRRGFNDGRMNAYDLRLHGMRPDDDFYNTYGLAYNSKFDPPSRAYYRGFCRGTLAGDLDSRSDNLPKSKRDFYKTYDYGHSGKT